VNPGLRTIVFSWQGIIEGLQRGDDGLNLLLHEFAHALWLEHKLMSNEYEVFNAELIELLERWSEHQLNNKNVQESHFFRRYAFENIEEFFAVAVENFFERSKEFKQALPELYYILVAIFKQDPLTINQLTSQGMSHYDKGIKTKL
jgi:Mlc titration factor MtfA (ptsG expression regulator)